MNTKFKEAFDTIKADDEFKNSTKNYVLNAMDKKATKHFYPRYALSIATCVFVFVTSLYWVYLVPTAEIDIDINPSIQLSINRLDKVIKAKANNQDGDELLEGIKTSFVDYEEVVDQILNEKTIINILNEDGVMMISVVSDLEDQEERVLKDMEHHSQKHHNVECIKMEQAESEHAHNLGLSCGKYRHYQILLDYGYDISVEEISNMTMREIKDLINEVANENPEVSQENNMHGHGGHHNQHKSNKCNKNQ